VNPRVHRNALAPGCRLHGYRIGRVLGQGGFGITYLADDLSLDRPVAIKEYLPLDLAVREGDDSVHPVTDGHAQPFAWGRERFAAEGRTLARCEHPNIVRVHAVLEANDTAYLVMRYEQGGTLQALLSRRRTLDEEELLHILMALLDGLESVHAERLVHRDVTPGNVLLREDGSPVLLDFGSARQALGGETRTLAALVSAGYAPLEQYRSRAGDQGPWTDVYGVAATLYRAIAGRAPADALDRSDARVHEQPDPLIPAVEVGSGGYSERFLRAIDAGLALRPEDRPRTVGEWRQGFEAARDGEEEPEEEEITDINWSRRGVAQESVADAGAAQTPAAKPATAARTAAPAPRTRVFSPEPPLAITACSVLGLLTFWVYTVVALSGRLEAHCRRRHADLGILLLTSRTPAQQRALARGFDSGPRAVRLLPFGYIATAILVAGSCAQSVLLSEGRPGAAIVLVVGASSLLFYATTLAFVLWLSRALARHERAEVELAAGVKGFDAEDWGPMSEFVARRERRNHHVVVFLVVALPLVSSPTLGVYAVHGGVSHLTATLIVIAVFAAAAVFHVWGSRLLVNLWNDHLRVERALDQS